MRKKYFERKWNIHFVEWSVAARKIPTIIAFIRADCCKIQRNRFVPLLFETDFFPFCDCRKNDKAVISKNFALDLYAIVNHGRSPIQNNCIYMWWTACWLLVRLEASTHNAIWLMPFALIEKFNSRLVALMSHKKK